MRMNAGIILAGQGPDILGNMARGQQAAQAQNDASHTNAFRAMLQQQGPGIMQGQENALASLAQFDPQAALGVQSTRQTMRIQEQQARQSYEAARRAAAAWAQSQDDATRAQTAAQVERALAMGTQAQTPEQWDQVMQQFAPQYAGQFDNRQMIIAGALGLRDALSMGQGPEMPAAVQTLQMRAQMAGLQPGTPEYQRFMASGEVDPQTSAAEQRIQRLIEAGVDRNTAIGIVDGRLQISRHPTTGAAVIVDMAQGAQVGAPVQVQGQAQPAPTQARPPLAFPPPRGAADPAFGLTGAAANVANTVGDVTGLGQPFPETGEQIADFRVLREQMLSDIANAYPRQPPSWLLQRIDQLTPRPGSVTQGAEGAQSSLRALGRNFEGEIEIARTGLSRQLTPTRRQELETQVAGLEAALARIQAALGRFEGGSQRQGRTQSGVIFEVID